MTKPFFGCEDVKMISDRDSNLFETAWIYWLQDATEADLALWEMLKTDVSKKNLHIIEVDCPHEVEIAHDALLLEGWELAKRGSGPLNRVTTYHRPLTMI